jgi:hypothetical protein
MKRKKALELQQAWGGKPCDHPAFAKEYDQGVRTGNFVCTRCGAILGFRERAAILAARRGDSEAGSPAEPSGEPEGSAGEA